VNQSAPPRILFLADAGAEVGGGHVMRCLTLARALSERGAECAFVESRAAAPILRRFGWPAQTLLAMADAQDLPALIRFGGEFADLFEADMVVVDHYGAGAAEETALRGPHRRIAVIDDLADRRHACDVLIDPGFGRRREHYAGLVRDTCLTLVGPGHALVRPEFAQARPRALSRRARHDPVRRVLVSFGLTDVGGITGRVVSALAQRIGDVRLDVALGPGAPSLAALAALADTDRRIHLHVDVQDMVALAAEADAALGAGGSSVWERACLGLPTSTVVLAENQAEMIARLAQAGAALALDARARDFEAKLANAWDRLIGDRELRWDLSQRSSELCDGRGAERVADAILDSLPPR
jgi:UDP-2,4-diacetamido-2,4,6-trideoxy-beta-L-altropyranose hydrolase